MLVLLFSLLTHFNPALKIHIETSHLICTVNQMIGFYMKYNAGLKWIKLDFYRNFRPLSLKLQITEGPALPTHTLCLWDKIPFLFSAEKLNNESLLNIEISRNSFHVACNALKSSKVKKTSQQIFTCSKSTIETIVKGCEICSIVLVSLLVTLNIFHLFSQRNKARKRAVRVEVRGEDYKNLKNGGGKQYRGSLYKVGGLGTLG